MPNFPTVAMRELMTPWNRAVSVGTGPVATETVKQLEQKRFDQAPVMQDGRPIGLVLITRLNELSVERRPLAPDDPSLIRATIGAEPRLDHLLSFVEKQRCGIVTAELDSEADQVLLLYKEKGKEAEGQMARIRVDVPVDKEAVEKALEELTSKDVESALAGIATAFVPKASHAEELLQKLHEGGHSIMAHIGVEILSDQQITASIGSVESDLDGRVLHQLSQDMGVSWRFLAAALDRVRQKFAITTDTLIGFMRPSPLFDPLREPLFREGLDAYLKDDHVKAVHVLVPQLEVMLRTLLGGLGQPTSKRMRSSKGVMQEKSLTDILEQEPAIAAFFKENDLQDWHVYLRVFLTDPRGWNLRNRLAHGLMAPHAFNRQVSDWVVHALLMLSLLRAKPAAEQGQVKP